MPDPGKLVFKLGLDLAILLLEEQVVLLVLQELGFYMLELEAVELLELSFKGLGLLHNGLASLVDVHQSFLFKKWAILHQ